MRCVLQAWHRHEAELRGWLRHRLGNAHDADDLLQDLFLKAASRGVEFCSIRDARAWLFSVARNALVDRHRLARPTVELPEDLRHEPDPEPPVVDRLAESCFLRVLSELAPEDREAITLCDLQGITQEEYARRKGLSTPGAKSRVQRARKRLRERLLQACSVRLDAEGRVSDFVPRVSFEG